MSSFLDITCGENKVEASMGSALGFLVALMLLQIGGMPIPKGNTGTAMWVLFMAVMVFQWSTGGLSLLMVIIAYYNVQDNYHHCMIRFVGDIALMDAVGLATFFFQPVVMMKLLVMTLYAVAMAEGTKLYLGCMQDGKDVATATSQQMMLPGQWIHMDDETEAHDKTCAPLPTEGLEGPEGSEVEIKVMPLDQEKAGEMAAVEQAGHEERKATLGSPLTPAGEELTVHAKSKELTEYAEPEAAVQGGDHDQHIEDLSSREMDQREREERRQERERENRNSKLIKAARQTYDSTWAGRCYSLLCWCGLCRYWAGSYWEGSYNKGRVPEAHRLAFFYFYFNPFFFTPLAFNIFFWVCSLSFLFSIVFFMPMMVSPCLFYYAVFNFLQWCHAKLEEVKEADNADKLGCVRPCGCKSKEGREGGTCAWLHAKLITNARDSIWFFNIEKESKSYLLTTVMLIALVYIVLSPLLIYGTWMALYVYSGRTTEENMNMAAFIYRYKYGILLGIQFHLPDIEFDIRLAYHVRLLLLSLFLIAHGSLPLFLHAGF